MFGLESSSVAQSIEQLYRRREQLISKKRRSPEEKAELKDIDEKMSKLPSGESPEEIAL